MNSESRRFYAVGVLAYLGLLFAGIVIVLEVLQLGNQWGLVEAKSTETHASPKSSSSVDVVFHVLFTLATVILLGAIFGRLCRYFGQPPVIGEVMALVTTTTTAPALQFLSPSVRTQHGN